VLGGDVLVGDTVRIEAFGFTPGGPGIGLGDLHKDGKDVPITFDADGTYEREFVAGEWMTHRQFDVWIEDLTDHCSAREAFRVGGATPTPTPGRNCYVSMPHVLVRIGERFVVEGHGLTPRGRGHGLGLLMPDRKDIALQFNADGTFRYEAIAAPWMLELMDGLMIADITDPDARCNADWWFRVLPADWIPDTPCSITLGSATGRYRDEIHVKGTGFSPHGSGFGFTEIDPAHGTALLTFDELGNLDWNISVTWREGEGLVAVQDGDSPCNALAVLTAIN